MRKKEKVNFSRNEIIELERRIALLGRYIIYRIKRETMRIIIACLTFDVTFALDVLALVAGGARPGAAHAEHDDQEQYGRGRPQHHPNHNLEHGAVIGCQS